MTTYLYPDPSYGTTVVRTNLQPNPRWIGDDAVSGASASTWTQRDVATGGPDGRGYTEFIVGADQTTGMFIGADEKPPVTPGEVYTGSLYAQASRGGVVLAARLYWYTPGGSTIGGVDGPDAAEAGGFDRFEVSGVAPDGAGQAAICLLIRSTGALLSPGNWVRVAMRQLEGGPVATEYFDGDTEAVFPYSYGWASTPNASVSYELVPAGMVSPKIVLNYATEVATGVTVLTPAFGRAPLIVRTEPKYLSGTFEFLAPDRATARQIFNLCDGSTNVRIVSDDGLVAATGTDQLRFTPTGTVRLSQNVPYDSWTVTVPYQEADYEEPA